MTDQEKNYKLFSNRLELLHNHAPQYDLSLVKNKSWNLFVDEDPDVADLIINRLKYIRDDLAQQDIKPCVVRRMIKQIGQIQRRLKS